MLLIFKIATRYREGRDEYPKDYKRMFNRFYGILKSKGYVF